MVSSLLRPAAALLSRKALADNLRIVRRRIKEQALIHRPDAQVMAVVKADAYGHDLHVSMPELLKHGVKRFALASISEAIEARKISQSSDLLVLGGTVEWSRSRIELIRRHDLEVTVNDLRTLKTLLSQPSLKLHLKLDTGMNRLGLKPDEWGEAIRLIQKSKLKLDGLMTHFATAGDRIFDQQVRIFEEAVRWFRLAGVRPRWVHSENSAALFTNHRLKGGILSEVSNLVRPGLAMWGYLPQGIKESRGLKPVLELVSEVCWIKRVEKGEGISYGHHYRATKPHDFGVVPLGYADGLSKQYADLLRVQWRSRKDEVRGLMSVCGSICMDMVMLRAAGGKMKVGDRAVFWGRFPNPLLKSHVVEPYELNLRIAKRIPRMWVK
jgi:alanine racemase